jgi:hypothetical protein
LAFDQNPETTTRFHHLKSTPQVNQGSSQPHHQHPRQHPTPPKAEFQHPTSTMPLSHVSLPIPPSAYGRMRAFYLTALKPLGYSVFKEEPNNFLGLQCNHNPDFWLHGSGDGDDDKDGPPPPVVHGGLTADENRKRLGGGRVHVAFEVGSRGAVEEWFRGAV